MASASCEISHFDPAIKSSFSTLGDKRIKEILSLERKVILGFLIAALSISFEVDAPTGKVGGSPLPRNF